jgi:hypothetical protein
MAKILFLLLTSSGHVSTEWCLFFHLILPENDVPLHTRGICDETTKRKLNSPGSDVLQWSAQVRTVTNLSAVGKVGARCLSIRKSDSQKVRLVLCSAKKRCIIMHLLFSVVVTASFAVCRHLFEKLTVTYGTRKFCSELVFLDVIFLSKFHPNYTLQLRHFPRTGLSQTCSTSVLADVFLPCCPIALSILKHCNDRREAFNDVP